MSKLDQLPEHLTKATQCAAMLSDDLHAAYKCACVELPADRVQRLKAKALENTLMDLLRKSRELFDSIARLSGE